MVNEIKILKSISESTRFRIIRLLLETKKEICGCEFVDSLEIPQYNLTKHLDILINAGLIKTRKESRWVYYSVCDNETPFCQSICQSILKASDKIHSEDLNRFMKRLDIRENGKCHLGIQNENLK